MTAAGFGTACAVALAVVLAVAAAAKVRDLAATAASFAALGLPRPAAMARVVPVSEGGIAVVLVLVPVLGGFLALVLLAFLTTFLASRLIAGVRAPCSCFGSRRSDPISAANLVGNGFLVLLALGALGAPRPERPTAVDLAVLAGAVAVEILVHTVVRRVVSRTQHPLDIAERDTRAVPH
jgi:uncharacterized membrane protein YphA (DoxX/SURF4 family)